MKNHKAGYVNLVGNPNVGKSTLMNLLVGERISIVTPKAQTTRHRILGIVNTEEYQIVFSDTPGMIEPSYKLQSSMMDFVSSAIKDADILIYMVEVGDRGVRNEFFFQKIEKMNNPILLLINKIDITNQESLEEEVDFWSGKLPRAEIFPISALQKFNIENVLHRIVELLPTAPPYFEKDALTDRPERFFVNEKIREKILVFLKKEIPYATEVTTESFEDSSPQLLKIRSIIIVERETQKMIVLGHKGSTITKIGRAARKDLEVFFEKKIFLELYVKVIKDWRKSEHHLSSFGYKDL